MGDDDENDDDEDNNIAWADRDCMATARDEEDDNDGTMTTTRTTITRKVDIFDYRAITTSIIN